ncbi:MAG: hypothetical protein WBD22_15080 [Pyrinomonadaceae bacterium]
MNPAQRIELMEELWEAMGQRPEGYSAAGEVMVAKFALNLTNCVTILA